MVSGVGCHANAGASRDAAHSAPKKTRTKKFRRKEEFLFRLYFFKYLSAFLLIIRYISYIIGYFTKRYKQIIAVTISIFIKYNSEY